MSLEITRCETDADYEAWRQVRIAVIPYERTQSLADIRRGDKPERLMLLAREDGVVVGHGLAQPSDLAGGGSVFRARPVRKLKYQPTSWPSGTNTSERN